MDTFRILVVDDEIDFLDALIKRMQKRKLDVTGVETGEKALELITEQFFDVVLLDVKLWGGMDGIETLREIKKIRPLTEVVLLTGHASIETSIEGMKLGASEYLLKPIKLEDLMLKLAILKRKDAQDHKIQKPK